MHKVVLEHYVLYLLVLLFQKKFFHLLNNNLVHFVYIVNQYYLICIKYIQVHQKNHVQYQQQKHIFLHQLQIHWTITTSSTCY